MIALQRRIRRLRRIIVPPPPMPADVPSQCPQCPNDEIMFSDAWWWCLICGWRGRRAP
jgi:hypothetical protein